MMIILSSRARVSRGYALSGDTKCGIITVFSLARSLSLGTSQTRTEREGTRECAAAPAVGALCIIAGCSDERMRLLAESGIGNHAFITLLFFVSVSVKGVPRGSARPGGGNRRRKEEGPSRARGCG